MSVCVCVFRAAVSLAFSGGKGRRGRRGGCGRGGEGEGEGEEGEEEGWVEYFA